MRTYFFEIYDVTEIIFKDSQLLPKTGEHFLNNMQQSEKCYKKCENLRGK